MDERELLAGASNAEAELFGGFAIGDFLKLLGGDFAGIAGPLIVMLYTANRGRIEAGSDRIMTPPAKAIDYALDRLGITDAEKRAGIHEAVREWGDKGGDVLVKIADAKAGGN